MTYDIVWLTLGWVDLSQSVNDHSYKNTLTIWRAGLEFLIRLRILQKHKKCLLKTMTMVRNHLLMPQHHLVAGSLVLGRIFEGSLVFKFIFRLPSFLWHIFVMSITSHQRARNLRWIPLGTRRFRKRRRRKRREQQVN